MALNASGPISLAGTTAGQSIALELGLGTSTQISLNDTAVRTLAGVLSGAIIMPTNFYGKSSFRPTQQGVFAFNSGGTNRNLVSSTGVIAAAVTGAGTNRAVGGSVTYGGDKGIFLSGGIINPAAISNLVSNTGVVAGDVSYAGTGKSQQAQCEYGSTGQAIQVCGTNSSGATGTSNLISNIC